MNKGLYIRIDEALLQRLDKVCKSMGYSRSEAIREAVRRFASTDAAGTHTHRIRGLVKTELTLDELEEAYEALR